MSKTKKQVYIDSKNETAVYLRELIDTQGWKIIERIIQDNIRLLEKRLFEGIDCDTIEKVSDVRNRIAIHREVMNLPSTLIDNCEMVQPKQDDLDPYE